MDNITGERIKKMLKAREMTQKDLACLVHVSPVTMNRYIQGDRKIPSDILQDISLQLQVDVRYLLGNVDDPLAYIVRDSLQLLGSFNPVPQDRLRALLPLYGYQSSLDVEADSEMVFYIEKEGKPRYILTGEEYNALADSVDLSISNTLDNLLEFSRKITNRKDNKK